MNIPFIIPKIEASIFIWQKDLLTRVKMLIWNVVWHDRRGIQYCTDDKSLIAQKTLSQNISILGYKKNYNHDHAQAKVITSVS